MFADNKRISARQFQALLLLYLLGLGLVNLYPSVKEAAGQDAWISALIAGTLAVGAMALMLAVTAAFPGKSFFEYVSALLTRPVAILISLAFAARLQLLTAQKLRLFCGIISRFALPDTPAWVVAAIMLALAAFAAAKGIETRGRVSEILIIVLFIAALVLAVFAMAKADYGKLLPVFDTSPQGLANGTITALSAFSGLELSLVALPMVRSKSAARPVMAAITIAVIALTAVTSAAATLPGGFAHGLDAIVISFWVIAAFAAVSAGLYYSAALVKDVFRVRKSPAVANAAVLASIAAVFALDRLTEPLEHISGILDLAFIFVLPIILFLAAKLRRLKAAALVMVCLCCFMLSGCGGVEIENRGFVIAVGLDKAADGGYEFSAALPDIRAIAAKNADSKAESIKTAAGEILDEAMAKADLLSAKKLYYGQTKVCLLGEDLLRDADMTRRLFAAMGERGEFGGGLLALCCKGSAKETLAAEIKGEPLTGMFIVEYYKNNSAGSALARFDEIDAGLRTSGCAVIPCIEVKDNAAEFSGAAVVKDYRLLGFISRDELRGLMFLVGGAMGDEVSVGGHSMTVTRCGAKTVFSWDGAADIRITVRGKAVSGSEALFADKIKAEASASLELFKDRYQADCFGFTEKLRKFYPGLYRGGVIDMKNLLYSIRVKVVLD